MCAVAGSIVSGYISDIVGHKRTLLGVYILWIVALMCGGLLDESFRWLIGGVVGVTLGGIWVVSRALVARLVPRERIGELFGIFNLVVYLSAIIGPVIWAVLLLLFSPWGVIGYRAALLCLCALLVVGIVFLLRIPRSNASELLRWSS